MRERMGTVQETTARPTYVTDPLPTTPDDSPRCQHQLRPTPDEVVLCDRPAVAVLIAPCCGENCCICATCLGIARGTGSWLCLGCGVKTDCRWTPMEFGIRWL
jgi:hypothetical protein